MNALQESNFMYFGNKDTQFTKDSPHCLCYFLQNTSYFVILSFYVQIIIMFYMNGVLIFVCPVLSAKGVSFCSFQPQ